MSYAVDDILLEDMNEDDYIDTAFDDDGELIDLMMGEDDELNESAKVHVSIFDQPIR
jgi:hypothetical protein